MMGSRVSERPNKADPSEQKTGRDAGIVSLADPSAYFSRLDDFEAHHWWPRVMRQLLVESLERSLDGGVDLTLVDVGCGTGRLLGRLAQMRPVGSAIGIEAEDAALKRANGRQWLIKGSAMRLPFDVAAVDVITCLDVLQHLPGEGDRVALGEMARVLRPGGMVFLRANAGGNHGYRLGRLRALVQGAGLQIQQATYLNMLPALAQECLGRVAGRGIAGKPHPEEGGLPAASPRTGGSRLLGGIAHCEALAVARLGVRLPWGHSTWVVACKPATVP